LLSIWSSLADVPDPRSGNARRHNLLDVLTIVLKASSCGAERCVDFADFACDRAALFREFLELSGGLPNHNTVRQLFRRLDPTALADCLAGFLDGREEGWPRRDCHGWQDTAPFVRPRGGPLAVARRHRLRGGRADGDRSGGPTACTPPPTPIAAGSRSGAAQSAMA
jgi:hypothetical protein